MVVPIQEKYAPQNFFYQPAISRLPPQKATATEQRDDLPSQIG